ncbi:NTP transferase domain-containing protein [Burkholderia ubonensis]|uniref:NTP transferase domain-containing protein n=1 Tax=Burkholderia ubonensis TaxID=101571 RepID=UPI000AFC0B05|nr:NTP transferase domain-containing protein [Burkholderia ubonensis]
MNAIILAAGLGTRFGTLTLKNHKALLSIGGIPNIERTLHYLRDAGVKDTAVVTGHMADRFDYLSNRYGCRLIHNPRFREWNNIYSMACASEYLDDTFVVDADVVLFENVFGPSTDSCYYTIVRRERHSMEWLPCVNDLGYVSDITVSNEAKPSLLGISYWSSRDCRIVRPLLKARACEPAMLSDPARYWDDIPRALLGQLRVRTIRVGPDSAIEMDTPDDYRRACALHELRSGAPYVSCEQAG